MEYDGTTYEAPDIPSLEGRLKHFNNHIQDMLAIQLPGIFNCAARRNHNRYIAKVMHERDEIEGYLYLARKMEQQQAKSSNATLIRDSAAEYYCILDAQEELTK